MEYKMFSYHNQWLPQRPTQYGKSQLTPHDIKDAIAEDVISEEIRNIESHRTDIRLIECSPVNPDVFLKLCTSKIVAPKLPNHKKAQVIGKAMHEMSSDMNDGVVEILVNQQYHLHAQSKGYGRPEVLDGVYAHDDLPEYESNDRESATSSSSSFTKPVYC